MVILYYKIIIFYSHNITFIDTFSIRLFAPEWLHINDLELLRTVPGTEFQCVSFHVQKNNVFQSILMNFWANGPRGPWAPIFQVVLKMYFMVWDLSRSVRMVFRSPGNPLIKLFHLLFD